MHNNSEEFLATYVIIPLGILAIVILVAIIIVFRGLTLDPNNKINLDESVLKSLNEKISKLENNSDYILKIPKDHFYFLTVQKKSM